MTDEGGRKNGVANLTVRDIAVVGAALVAFGALQAQTLVNSHRIDRFETAGSPSLGELREKVNGLENRIVSIEKQLAVAKLIPAEQLNGLFSRLAVMEKDLHDLEQLQQQQRK
jgi:hypothetical protein